MLRYRERGKALTSREHWLDRLLRNRGIDPHDPAEKDRFLHPDWDELKESDPFIFPDMEKAVSLIRQAVGLDQLICVYGDYDVDGVCATSILVMQLRSMGARVEYRIPRRDEGYGMNCNAMQ